MYKIIIRVFIIILWPGFSVAQVVTEIFPETGCNTLKNKKELVIQEISIGDSVLLNQLNLFIREQKLKDTLFKYRGFVTVHIGQHPYNGRPVKRSYYINQQFHSFDSIDNEQNFPFYYTWVQGRMVLIYIYFLNGAFCYRFSKKSKLRFQQTIEPFLAKKYTTRLRDKQGNITKAKNFRPDEVFRLHGGGKLICIFDDSSTIITDL